MECHVTGCGVMSSVCILLRDGVSCPVSVYCDRTDCHVLCMYTVTGIVGKYLSAVFLNMFKLVA